MAGILHFLGSKGTFVRPVEELPGPRGQPVGGMMVFWHGLFFLTGFFPFFFRFPCFFRFPYSEVFKAKRWAAGGSGGKG